MNAAAARAELAAIGRDLVALAGDPGELRAAALLAPTPPRATAGFADLSAAPDWLRLPREAQRELARRAALLAMAPALAASIDGAWLGDLAELAGEGEIDWAIAQAGDLPADSLRAIPVAELESTGFTLMRAALPDALTGYLDWTKARLNTDVANEDSCAPAKAGAQTGPPPSRGYNWFLGANKALARFCVARAAERMA